MCIYIARTWEELTNRLQQQIQQITLQHTQEREILKQQLVTLSAQLADQHTRQMRHHQQLEKLRIMMAQQQEHLAQLDQQVPPNHA